MKRQGNLWPLICDRRNIELAADKALKGKPLTKDRQRFIDNRDELLNNIEESLTSETYKFGALYSFTVYEPKQREIHCPRFYPDRIIHHALMSVVVPLFMQKFTADTYGSIQGRGVALAVKKLSKTLRDHPDTYFLQIDIKHFYQNIGHDVAKEQIARVIKCRKTLKLFDAIIDVHGQGMPIGSYTSQYVGNLVLSPIDHWAKEVLGIKHYYRYMDDMVMILPDKASCHKVLEEFKEQLNTLKLTIKNNAVIAPATVGIDFIGYKFYPSHTRLRKRIKVKMQRNANRLRRKNVNDEEFKRKFASHFGWCKHADCRNLLRKTLKDKLYIFEDNMKIKRLSEIKEANNWFALPKGSRVSIEKLFDTDLIFLEYIDITIKLEPKVAVKFAHSDNADKHLYFITRSDVMKDRLSQDKDHFPFIAQLKRVKNYTAYE